MRRLAVTALVVAVLVAAALIMRPSTLVNDAGPPALPDTIERYLADTERQVADSVGLVPGTEKRIRWYRQGARSAYAVVYLHGFSASRQAYAPAIEMIADGLGANLFETRLAGHGQRSAGLTAVTAEDWLDDAAEALAIAARLGDGLVLIGTSTGATLALAMASEPAFADVAALVLVSPNFRPADGRAGLLTGPAGPLLARLLVGGTRSFEPYNERHARYWTTRYPIDAAVEMMRLVDYSNALLPLEIDAALLVVYSPNDAVVSTQAITDVYAAIRTPDKKLVVFEHVDDPVDHVLAGDVLSPGSTDALVEQVVRFVRAAGERNPQ